MTQQGIKKDPLIPQKVLKNARNRRRLSTLKLWQLHLESLSTPQKKPLLSRYHEDSEITEMHTISATTIISSDQVQTRVKYIEDDETLAMLDLHQSSAKEH